ncbi:M15 family metallopeptidase [Candidatus Peregrinibacteria bacterium]|nr:MAG: M15 family metallopeptidase [Candidatus Peregrinibacteria bacterium]
MHLKDLFFRQNIKHFILRMGITFFSSWIFHTYILAFKLDGFHYQVDNSWSQYVTTDQSSFLIYLVWFLFGFLFWSTMDSISYYGLKKYCHLLLTTPFEIIREIFRLDQKKLFLLFGFIGASLLIGKFLGQAFSFTLGLTIIFVIGNFFGDFLLRFLFWNLHKMLKYFHKSTLLTKSFTKILIFIFGITLIVSAFVPLKWLLGFALVGAASMFFFKKNNSRVAHLFFWAINGVVFISLLDAHYVSADDGGWSEAGGSFGKWLMSDGFLDLLETGLNPSLFCTFGAFGAGVAAKAKSIGNDPWGPSSTWDPRNVDRLKDCHPDVIQNGIDFINHVEKDMGIRLRVNSDGHFRTMNQQDEIRKTNSKATNAKGGKSWHNYGRAIDVSAFDNKGQVITFDDAGKRLPNGTWRKISEIAKQHGFDDWGGAWSNKYDPGHFGNTGGKTLKGLENAYKEQKKLHPNKSDNEIILGF